MYWNSAGVGRITIIYGYTNGGEADGHWMERKRNWWKII